MALGDQIGQASGRITGTRVITPLGTQQAQIEVSFQGNGTLLGQNITEIGTYWQTLRPGGVLYGEGDLLWGPTLYHRRWPERSLEGLWGG
jgi:hypothetical protein